MAVSNPAAILPVLRPVPIFNGLRKATLFEIARRSVEVAYPPGATVVRQGDPGDALFIVAAGHLDVSRDGVLVARLSAGDYFGEISLIDGEPRSATVVAADDAAVLRLDSADFESLLAVPYVARAVMRNLARLFRDATGSHGASGP